MLPFSAVDARYEMRYFWLFAEFVLKWSVRPQVMSFQLKKRILPELSTHLSTHYHNFRVGLHTCIRIKTFFYDYRSYFQKNGDQRPIEASIELVS